MLDNKRKVEERIDMKLMIIVKNIQTMTSRIQTPHCLEVKKENNSITKEVQRKQRDECVKPMLQSLAYIGGQLLASLRAWRWKVDLPDFSNSLSSFRFRWLCMERMIGIMEGSPIFWYSFSLPSQIQDHCFYSWMRGIFSIAYNHSGLVRQLFPCRLLRMSVVLGRHSSFSSLHALLACFTTYQVYPTQRMAANARDFPKFLTFKRIRHDILHILSFAHVEHKQDILHDYLLKKYTIQ